VDTANPIDAFAINSGFSSTATTTAITTSASNEEVVSLFATDVSKTFGTPTGTNQKYNLSHTPLGPSTAADDTLQVSTGNTGSVASSIDAHQARYWSSQQIALKHIMPSIAIDNQGEFAQNGATNSFTFPFAVAGSNRVLIVRLRIDDVNPDQLVSATYAGASLTLIKKIVAPGSALYFFALVAPQTGTNNLVFTTQNTVGDVIAEVADYTGVSQAIPSNYVVAQPMGQSSFSVGPLSTGVNSWIAGSVFDTESCVTLSGAMVRATDTCSNLLFDSNGPTGGNPATVNFALNTSSGDGGAVMVELAPATQ